MKNNYQNYSVFLYVCENILFYFGSVATHGHIASRGQKVHHSSLKRKINSNTNHSLFEQTHTMGQTANTEQQNQFQMHTHIAQTQINEHRNVFLPRITTAKQKRLLPWPLASMNFWLTNEH